MGVLKYGNNKTILDANWEDSQINEMYWGDELVWTRPDYSSPLILSVSVNASDTIYLKGMSDTSKTINWGDGYTDTGVTATNTSHTYVSTGTKTISISGGVFTGNGGLLGTSKLKLIRIISWGTFFNNIGVDAFAGCKNLIQIPSSWVGLERLLDGTRMFSGCTGLTSLPSTWSGLDNLINGTYMFEACIGITALPKSWEHLSKLRNATGMFRMMYGLLTVPSSCWYLDELRIMTRMFMDSYNLTNASKTQYATLKKVTDVKECYRGCTDLKGTMYTLYSYLANKSTPVTSYSNWIYGCTNVSDRNLIPAYWGGGYSGVSYTSYSNSNAGNAVGFSYTPTANCDLVNVTVYESNSNTFDLIFGVYTASGTKLYSSTSDTAIDTGDTIVAGSYTHYNHTATPTSTVSLTANTEYFILIGHRYTSYRTVTKEFDTSGTVYYAHDWSYESDTTSPAPPNSVPSTTIFATVNVS